MDPIGLDLHKRETQICSIAKDRTVTELRIATTPERFQAVLLLECTGGLGIRLTRRS